MDVGAVAVRHEPASAALVRRAIADDLASHGVAVDRIDDVLLVASELVGNAVLHAPDSGDDAPLDIVWDIADDHVTVRVADGSSRVPLRRTSSATESNGRGLAIVAAIAAEWGVELTSTGKRVWARVRISTA